MNATVQHQVYTEVVETQKVTSKKSFEELIANCWAKIAPSWPLKNLIAVNPLAGLEDLSFESALNNAAAYFQQADMPTQMQAINRESIKWLQAFFDDGQATIHMPNRHLGLFKSVISLIKYDKNLYKHDLRILDDLLEGSNYSELELIVKLLSLLEVEKEHHETFMTLLLTTLPGWSAYIRYRTDWPDKIDAYHPFSVSKQDYLAFRILLTYLMWPDAKQIIQSHNSFNDHRKTKETYQRIQHNDYYFQQQLLNKMCVDAKHSGIIDIPKAQFIFCIDVRSEPLRKAIESQGAYETFGFAGFFGVPVAIENQATGKSHASCPVLLKPAYKVTTENRKNQQIISKHKDLHKKVYQSLKYNSITPFALVEIMGVISGISMMVKSLFAKHSSWAGIFNKRKDKHTSYNLENFSLQQQVECASDMLKLIGLVENFAPIVILCGHASSTKNNAYASALDCGACGGRPGGPNARIMASIMNSKEVRTELTKIGINIPDKTVFISAEHNTTTDDLTIYDEIPNSLQELIKIIKADLRVVQHKNTAIRLQNMGKNRKVKSVQAAALHAKDWAEVRPEWGLAKNAAFIAGPRNITQGLDLEGRAFLHSYDWQIDHDTELLNTIMTAPMIVAQWINAQYLFSSLDNVAYGAGSKITKNITGKIGVMQGNASDLMNGLPLQSVYKSDNEPHHIPTRLTTYIYAPLDYVKKVIDRNQQLQQLFSNEWLHLFCYDPILKSTYTLQRSLTWKQAH